MIPLKRVYYFWLRQVRGERCGEYDINFNKWYSNEKINFRHNHSQAIMGIESFCIGLAVLRSADKSDLRVNWNI